MSKLSLPLRLALVLAALTIAGSLVVACAERALTGPDALRSEQIASQAEARIVRLRPVLQNGQTANVPPRVIRLERVDKQNALGGH
jgi:hypothetical protein